MVQEVWVSYGEARLQQDNFWSLCICAKILGDDFIILLLYVDDMLIIGKNASRIDGWRSSWVSFSLWRT